MMKNSKLNLLNKYMQNISRSKSFGKFVCIVYANKIIINLCIPAQG